GVWEGVAVGGGGGSSAAVLLEAAPAVAAQPHQDSTVALTEDARAWLPFRAHGVDLLVSFGYRMLSCGYRDVNREQAPSHGDETDARAGRLWALLPGGPCPRSRRREMVAARRPRPPGRPAALADDDQAEVAERTAAGARSGRYRRARGAGTARGLVSAHAERPGARGRVRCAARVGSRSRRGAPAPGGGDSSRPRHRRRAAI